MSRAPDLKQREGFSIVEILVGMSLLSVVMMGLASAATLGLSQMAKARQDLQYSADVQQIADSLVAKGSCASASGQTWAQTCGNNLVDGSTTIRGRAVNWTVTNVNAKSQKVTIVAQRRGQANTSLIYSDTVTLYLADIKVQ
ncbi:MAG TPA: prepilin-type N-terminal cleavage/methylation domain-containing protein [Gemmatimonadaceae bacterium]|nr:prepilin-type N-terminal cleavage/methylation domain-containing protein [Gemmatimonadaceae bacterium]